MRLRPDPRNGTFYDPLTLGPIIDTAPKHKADHWCHPRYVSDNKPTTDPLDDPHDFFREHGAYCNKQPYFSRFHPYVNPNSEPQPGS
jgi:hypothetical protein